MSVETLLYATLADLVEGKVFRDRAPDNETVLPRIIFQQVGGRPINFIDSATIPDKHNARIQINVWHRRRDDANALAQLVEDAMRAVPALHTTVLSEHVALYEPESKVYGTMQDFSVWT